MAAARVKKPWDQVLFGVMLQVQQSTLLSMRIHSPEDMSMSQGLFSWVVPDSIIIQCIAGKTTPGAPSDFSGITGLLFTCCVTYEKPLAQPGCLRVITVPTCRFVIRIEWAHCAREGLSQVGLGKCYVLAAVSPLTGHTGREEGRSRTCAQRWRGNQVTVGQARLLPPPEVLPSFCFPGR